MWNHIGTFIASLCNFSKKVTGLPPFSISVPLLDLSPELGFRTMSHITECTISPSVYVLDNNGEKECQLTPFPMNLSRDDSTQRRERSTMALSSWFHRSEGKILAEVC